MALRETVLDRATDPQSEALEAAQIRTPEVAQAWVPAARQEMDLRPALRLVRCPRMALVGELDPFNPPRLTQEIVDGMPGDRTRLCVVPDAAHRVFADNPRFAQDRIREFLTDLT